MVKISNFICVQEVNNNEKTDDVILRKPISTLFLENLPNNFSFFVFFSIVDIDWNLGERHLLGLSVMDPEGNCVFEINNVQIPLETPSGEKLHDLSANFAINNVRFGMEGLHEIKLTVDNAISKTYFAVRKL